MTNFEGQDESEILDWTFWFRSPDIARLQKVATDLEDEFTVDIQETVTEMDEEGNVSDGAPSMAVIERAALSDEEVEALTVRMKQIAADAGIEFEGVDSYEPVDMEDLFGWLEPEEAGWRLRNMTDSGLEPDADLPWTFLIQAPSLDAMRVIAKKLGAAGYDDRDDFDEPDEDGDYGTCVFVPGRNNEPELQETAVKISKIVEAQGGSLVGIQFYTREDIAEVFGTDDEDFLDDFEDD